MLHLFSPKVRRRRRHCVVRLESLEPRQLLHGGSLAADVAPEGEGEQVADFALLDVNPTSPTYNQTVSPRDHSGRVSAWYFGHAT